VGVADFTQTHPGEQTTGAAATFDQARADFEDAWKVLLSKRTEADFQAWRDNRDWTDALILVGRPTMFARIGMMRALNPHVERLFDRARIRIGESAN
jgi:hypothetical protein